MSVNVQNIGKLRKPFLSSREIAFKAVIDYPQSTADAGISTSR
jgi:hypothetical protein